MMLKIILDIQGFHRLQHVAALRIKIAVKESVVHDGSCLLCTLDQYRAQVYLTPYGSV